MAKRKTTATPREQVEQLVDWRVGYHVEAGAKMIADALHRIADQMQRDRALKAEEVALRREHLLAVLESKAVADKAAQRLLGMMPDFGVDLRPLARDGKPPADDSTGRGPEWVKDVLADAAAHTERL